MERPITKPLGTPVEQLDTPTMVVDIDALEENIETLHSFFRQRRAKVRPHVEAHRCPAIAEMQLASAGTVGGISVTTLGEAEVFADHGFSDIFVANEIVTPRKIQRLCALSKQAKITVATDSLANVRDLSEASSQDRVPLRVVVEIHTGLERCGVEPGRPAVDLAKAISAAGGLIFAGLMTYEGTILTEDPQDLTAESRKWIQQVLDTREMLEREGLEVQVVSVGATHNYEVAGSMSGVTEVPAGSYALMDYRYLAHRPQFKSAARIMSTVTSCPDPGTAIIDAGQKAAGTDTGLAVVDGTSGAQLTRMAAEHGIMSLDETASDQLHIGDKVWLLPREAGSSINVYDFLNVVRDGKLEAVWDVAARGRYS